MERLLEWAPLVRDLEATAAADPLPSRAEEAVAAVVRQLGATSGSLYLRDPCGCKMQRVGGHGERGGEPEAFHPGVGVGGVGVAGSSDGVGVGSPVSLGSGEPESAGDGQTSGVASGSMVADGSTEADGSGDAHGSSDGDGDAQSAPFTNAPQSLP